MHKWMVIGVIVFAVVGLFSLTLACSYRTQSTEIVGVEITHLDSTITRSNTMRYEAAFRCDDFSGIVELTPEQYGLLQEGDIVEVEREIGENAFGDTYISFSYIGRLGET